MNGSCHVNYISLAKLTLIISILTLSIGEYKASGYANALYVKEKPIRFGINISRCVDVVFTSSEDLFYIYDGAEYSTHDNLQLKIKKLCGYGIDRDSMFVLVEIGQENYVSMGFGCEKDVILKAPTLTYQKRSDVDWVILHQMPYFIYYWRFIAFLISLNLILCVIVMCIRFAKKILSSSSIRKATISHTAPPPRPQPTCRSHQ